MRGIFLFILSLLLVKANAQGINFQGVARSANGTILSSQKISLKLSILNGSSTGTAEYVETRTVSTNAQGIFSVVIGDTGTTSNIGSYANVNWKLSSKFLKVEMDPTGGSNFISMGTTTLQYVPFSYYSNGVDAANVSGVLPIKSGGTGVANISEMKVALALDKVNNTADLDKPISTLTQTALDTKLNKADTTSLSNRINSKLAGTDTASLSNRINTKLDITSEGYMPNGLKPGTMAVWNGRQWVMDTLLLNNGRRISIGENSISDSSAILNISSNNAGLLLPRLTETQRDNIRNPSEGLMIYCLDYYGVGKGGALQIRTAGKWITLFSYNLNQTSQDCPSINTWEVVGLPIKDSVLTINYTTQSSNGSSVSQEPFILWFRGRYDNNNLVYDIIQGENAKTYKVKAEDVNGLKATLIPRNKPGAVCLVGDSVFQRINVVNYYNITTSTAVNVWQNVIDSISTGMFIFKPSFDLVTDNLKNGSSYSETMSTSRDSWDNLYSNIKKLTFYINKFSNPVADQYKDVYGQLLAMRSVLYFYALRIYSHGNSQGVPIIDNRLGIDGSLVRTSKSSVIDYIISDLNRAETNLNSFTSNKKISKLFATAFIAKVLLFKGDYLATVTQCLKVINDYNLSGNTLVNSANYFNIYNDTTNFSSSNEILYQYSLKNGFNLMGFLTNSNSETAINANSWVYELTTEGYNLFNASGTNDIRRFFISRNTTSNVYFYNKYLYVGNNTYGGYNQSYSKVFTMPELYLIYAEALARTGNTSSANTYLNKVAMARDQSISAYNIVNQTDLLNQILTEKRKELFAEGEYFYDYLRIKGYLYNLTYYSQYNTKTNVPSQLYTGFPIPSNVISLNPNITQNPGF